MISTSEIITETNQIANGIYDNVHKPRTSITVTASHELRIASIEAASKIMQAKILAKVIDDKSFR